MWNDGTTYEGEFKDGQIDGYGTTIRKNGKKYEGNYKNNMMEGYGEFYWPDG